MITVVSTNEMLKWAPNTEVGQIEHEWCNPWDIYDAPAPIVKPPKIPSL